MNAPAVRVITDRDVLWSLTPGMKLRELDSPYRLLVVGFSRQWLWCRAHPVPINDVEMPVEVVE